MKALSILKALSIWFKTSVGKEPFSINQREPCSALVDSPFVVPVFKSRVKRGFGIVCVISCSHRLDVCCTDSS
jgi:hypothetical protein